MKSRRWRWKDLFLPTVANNQQAKILHPSFLSFLVAGFLVVQFSLNYFSLFFPRVLGYASNIVADRLVELTNQERTKQGLAPLSNNATLNEAALRKAGDMFALNYWAHNSPNGRTPWSFFKDVGYGYVFAGENLARDFNDSESVVSAWMNSPSHRENILNGHYEEIGIAVVNGTLQGVETTLVVQMFGKPAVKKTASSPSVQSAASVVEQVAEVFKPKPALASGESTSSAWLSDLVAAAQLSSDEDSQPLVSPFSLTRNLVVLIIGSLMAVLLLDFYFVTKKGILRLSGRTMAHLSFLLYLLLAIIIIQPGLVL